LGLELRDAKVVYSMVVVVAAAIARVCRAVEAEAPHSLHAAFADLDLELSVLGAQGTHRPPSNLPAH